MIGAGLTGRVGRTRLIRRALNEQIRRFAEITEPGKAVFRTEASGPDGADTRVALDDGEVEYVEG